MTSIPRLTSEQQSLLCLIVEASRVVPREEFYFFEGSNDIQHLGLPENHEIFPSDLLALTNAWLLNLQRRQQGMSAFEPTALACDVYGLLKQRQGEPVKRVEAKIRPFFDHDGLREAHPEAFKKWLQAEELLWRSDTEPQLTTIGHLAREAMQEFATSLMKRYGVPEGDTEKAKTINRVKKSWIHSRVSLVLLSRSFSVP